MNKDRRESDADREKLARQSTPLYQLSTHTVATYMYVNSNHPNTREKENGITLLHSN